MRITTRRAFSYWHDSLQLAPELLQQCHQTWRVKNPDYEFLVLSSETYQDYVAPRYHRLLESWRVSRNMTPQSFTDILRLLLLHENGGLWIDMSCVCVKPLDDFLHALPTIEGISLPVYRSIDSERQVDNWFISVECEQNRLLQAIIDSAIKYLVSDQTPADRTWVGRKMLRLTQKSVSRTQWWLSPVLSRHLKLRPYFWFQYLAWHKHLNDKCDTQDLLAKGAINATSANIKYLGTDLSDSDFKAYINSQKSPPLVKLKWKNVVVRNGDRADWLLRRAGAR